MSSQRRRALTSPLFRSHISPGAALLRHVGVVLRSVQRRVTKSEIDEYNLDNR